MRSTIKTFIIITFILLFLGGCATSRGIVNLQIPKANIPTQSNGKSIFIRSVTDDRTFQQNPSTPDIPSLGFGGAGTASNELKKRAIARKRNTYGKALGDILLKENQTVESIIKDSLTKSFYELGYEVIDKKETMETNIIIIDVSIEKFWSWMNIGFWALTLSSEIETKITLTNPKDETKEIYVKSEGNYQIASGKNWLEIMNKSLQQFDDKVKEHFSSK
ncbi:MAG: flagellar biosynthesis protein [Proteobacteria bacterium]|nr:flagellar biosynthesis protein [Pseudomonadota bacterium]